MASLPNVTLHILVSFAVNTWFLDAMGEVKKTLGEHHQSKAGGKAKGGDPDAFAKWIRGMVRKHRKRGVVM